MWPQLPCGWDECAQGKARLTWAESKGSWPSGLESVERQVGLETPSCG